MKLETERLILRKPRLSDAESIAKNIDNLEISKWLLAVPHPYKLNDAVWWINEHKKKDQDYSFCIELKSEKGIIGGMGLSKVDLEKGKADVGYWLGVDYHRKGYASEALTAILDLALNKLELKVIEAGVFKGNPSSGKLLEKFGFKRIGSTSKAVRCKADGKIKYDQLYRLLREDY